MKADGSVIIDTKIIDGGMEKGFEQLKSKMNSVGVAAEKVGDAGGNRAVGIFPDCHQQLLHRPEHSGRWRRIHQLPLCLAEGYIKEKTRLLKDGSSLSNIISLCLKPLVLGYAVDRNERQEDRSLLYVLLEFRIGSVCDCLTYFKSARSAEHHIDDSDVTD